MPENTPPPAHTALEPVTEPSTTLTAATQSPISAQHAALSGYLQAASTDNTQRTYLSALRQFSRWGGLLPTSTEQLIRYLLAQAPRLSPRTLALHLTALRQWHRAQGLGDPTDNALVEQTLRGIRRVHARPQQAAKALRLPALWSIADALAESDQLVDCRDRALLLIGFFGAFRGSELVGINHEAIRFEPEGVLITLPRSKTDQVGEGIVRAIPRGSGNNSTRCAVAALEQWLAQSGITDGAVFRSISRWGQLHEQALSAKAVTLRIKARAAQVGLEEADQFSSHSLRRGMATEAARLGVGFASIKKQGGWRSDQSVWRYIEQGQRFEDNAASALMTDN